MENNTDIRRGREFEAEIAPFLCGGHLWSRSYYAGSAGGAPLNVIAEYVKAQDRPSA